MATDSLFREASDSYYQVAGTELSMNYYSLFEGWIKASSPEEESDLSEERTSLELLCGGKKFFLELSEIVKTVFESNDELKDSNALLDKAMDLRERLKTRTLTIASYTDLFRLYEYILKRIKPYDAGRLEDINNDACARDILSGIFASEDNTIINENIKYAVSQLPLRMTKAKFYDILDNTFQRYIGSGRSSLDRLVYMIRSSAGILSVSTKDASDPDIDILKDNAKYFSEIDFSELSPEAFDEATDRLKEVVKLLIDTTDLFQSMAEVINLVCVCIINYNRVSEFSRNEIKTLYPVFEEASNGILSNKRDEMSNEVFKCFMSIEGKLEKRAEKLERIESKISSKSGYSDEEEAYYDSLMLCSKLMSASLFVDLDEADEEPLTDETYEAKSFKCITDEFDLAFKISSKNMKRAMMAATLAELPVFFNSRTEVMNYVRDSIDGCRDLYEKLVGVRLVLDALKD